MTQIILLLCGRNLKISSREKLGVTTNKLELQCKLYSLYLKDRGKAQEHIKTMTNVFKSLSVIGDPVYDEDCVIYFLASLPDAYDMLVMAHEANQDMPQMNVVTEHLLHKECKLNGYGSSSGTNNAMTAYHYKKMLYPNQNTPGVKKVAAKN